MASKNIQHTNAYGPLRLAINKLPFELGWDIWHRYYTFVVLDKLLDSSGALVIQFRDCHPLLSVIFDIKDLSCIRGYYPSEFDKFISKAKAKRRRHWTTELC